MDLYPVELSESDISLCLDEIPVSTSIYSLSCSKVNSDIQNPAVTCTFLCDESYFSAVSQSGDDINRYQPPNSENKFFLIISFKKLWS